MQTIPYSPYFTPMWMLCAYCQLIIYAYSTYMHISWQYHVIKHWHWIWMQFKYISKKAFQISMLHLNFKYWYFNARQQYKFKFNGPAIYTCMYFLRFCGFSFNRLTKYTKTGKLWLSSMTFFSIMSMVCVYVVITVKTLVVCTLWCVIHVECQNERNKRHKAIRVFKLTPAHSVQESSVRGAWLTRSFRARFAYVARVHCAWYWSQIYAIQIVKYRYWGKYLFKIFSDIKVVFFISFFEFKKCDADFSLFEMFPRRAKIIINMSKILKFEHNMFKSKNSNK